MARADRLSRLIAEWQVAVLTEERDRLRGTVAKLQKGCDAVTGELLALRARLAEVGKQLRAQAEIGPPPASRCALWADAVDAALHTPGGEP